MCTVTYLPLGDGVVITSNRDEKTTRARAIPPKEYRINNTRLVFPKDPKAGGTWVAMNENGSMAVLLNGGWEKHSLQPVYRKSRGLVFLEIVSAPEMVSAFSAYDLEDIEPFTLVMFAEGKPTEARWDGAAKFVRVLPWDQPQIWSSVTLYGPEMIQQREQWFADWRQRHTQPTVADIQHFHCSAGEGNVESGLLINREGYMKTVSITSLHLADSRATMHYTDLSADQEHSIHLDVNMRR